MASSLHAWSNVGSCVCWNSCRNAWKWGVGDGKRPCKFIYIVNLSKEMWICFFKAFTAYHLNKHKVWLHTWKALCPGGLCHASNRRLHATLGSMWGWFFQLHPSICQRSSHDCGLLVFCRFMTPLFCSHPAALCHPSIHPSSILSWPKGTPAASYLIHSWFHWGCVECKKTTKNNNND